MTLRTRCKNTDCLKESERSLTPDEALQSWPCPGCGAALVSAPAESWCQNDRVERCPCCGGREFFVRKDFPQRLGLALVVVAGLAGFILLQRHPFAAACVLGGVVLLDALLYLVVGRVTVCYRCRAELRGTAEHPDHRGFDLATAEKYPRPS